MQVPRLAYLICFLNIPLFLISQEYRSYDPVIIEDLIEQIARFSDEERDYQTLFYDIAACLEDPLNINTATREELERLHVLTHFQITSLRDYIREHGPLLSIYELPMVYGFDVALARMIEPLVMFEPTVMPRELAGEKPKSSHQLLLRTSAVLEEQLGYSPATDSLMGANPDVRYLGNRMKVLTKYRFRLGNRIEAGYTGEKDAGEPFLKEYNLYGFDFNSAFIRINDFWKFKSITAGDYQVRTGQGVNLGSGLAFGKSPDIINIRKKGPILTPYTSTNENRFMRGISAELENKWLSFTGFASYKKIDANTYIDTLVGKKYFSSFLYSGQHGVPREFEDKDAVGETIFGAYTGVRFGNLNAGATLLHYNFDAYYQKSVPVSHFDFSGSSNTNAGFDYTWSGDRFIVFGEGGYSGNGTFALLNGAGFDLHSQVTLSLLHRYFDRAYHALYGNAFTENNYNRNENGLYTGIKVLPLPNWKLSGYLDAYIFPFLKKQVSSPSSGFDYHLQATFSRREGINAYIRYRYKAKPENVSVEQPGIPTPVREKVSHLRFHISYPVASGFSFTDRVELSTYEKKPGSRESGFLAYHDVLYRPAAFPLSFSFRYSMFDTDSYQSRIYTYEHDVLYAFSIPFYYGRGIRTYLNAKWKISRHLDLWLKYAMAWYPDRANISSGLNEIPGNRKPDLRVQARVKF